MQNSEIIEKFEQLGMSSVRYGDVDQMITLFLGEFELHTLPEDLFSDDEFARL